MDVDEVTCEYHTDEKEFAKYPSSDSDSDDSEVQPDPLDLDEADGAQISRKRSFQRTSYSKSSDSRSKRTRVAHGASTKVDVSAQQRVSEFPGETLTVSNGKLYCQACSQVLSRKKSIVANHLSTQHHKEKKAARVKDLERQQNLAKNFQAYRQREASRLSGTGLTAAVSDEEIVQRVETVTAWLQAGIPLAKLNFIRPLLERNNQRLTEATHLAQYVPFVLDTENGRVCAEVEKAEFVSVLFDGSTRQGEALAVMVRFVDEEYEVKQLLVRLHVLAKSLTGEQLAREIIKALSTELRLPEGKVVAAIRDGASVNTAAMRHVSTIMYPLMADIICSSHSLDNVGKRFSTPTLDVFLQLWVSLFSHSPAAKLQWRATAGETIKSYSATRWWSWWEVLKQLHRLFDHVQPFLGAMESSPSTRRRLLDVLEDVQQSQDLRLQLAVVLDAGEPFVSRTYLLEGDGELVTLAYDYLQEVATACALQHYPITETVAHEMANGDAGVEQNLMTQAKQCVRPAIVYFQQRFNHVDSPLHKVVKLFKALRMLNPAKATTLNLTSQRIDELRCLPVLDSDAFIQLLKDELATYLVAAAEGGMAEGESQLSWWKRQTRLPTWQKAAKATFALLPSSAPVERVFSLLKAYTSHLQTQLLEDQLEAALMLQCNRGRSLC